MHSKQCDTSCAAFDQITESILLVHLGAIGAVVRSTALLQSLKIKHPQAKLVWITAKPCDQLLKSHPLIDLVLTDDNILAARAFDFSLAYVVDKSIQAVGIAKSLNVQNILGFTADSVSGAIVPANSEATELWQLGLDNQQKFFINQKTEVELMLQALKLPKADNDYSLPLNRSEASEGQRRQVLWQKRKDQPVIGINTGCSPMIPYKKLSIDYHRRLIQRIHAMGFHNVVLLGGPEDSIRNQQIAQDLPVIQSPTNQGLRDGLISVGACDIVLSGDSLGMHMSISQQKFVIAWFGPTCAQEIELYGRGVKILSLADCGPCWKRLCEKKIMCYDLVAIEDWVSALEKGILWWQKKFLLSRQPSSEICS